MVPAPRPPDSGPVRERQEEEKLQEGLRLQVSPSLQGEGKKKNTWLPVAKPTQVMERHKVLLLFFLFLGDTGYVYRYM